MLNTAVIAGALVLTAIIAGRANQTEMLENKQAMALQTAVSRAQFQANCQSATGEIISREVVQPALW